MATISRIYSIGQNRGRPRLWLDGAPLTGCGFAGGTSYHLTHGPGWLVLTLAPQPDAQVRRVTGRPDGKSIIDIVGGTIAEAFPGVAKVRVLYTPGQIVVTQELEDSAP